MLVFLIPLALPADRFRVSVSLLCHWFGVLHLTDRPTKRYAKVQPELADLIKALIEQEPSFGYRTVAGLLGMNKNTLQRIFQLRAWHIRKRAIGHRPHIDALVSVATAPDQRWTIDLCRAWGRREFITSLSPRQNGLAERVTRPSKKQCVQRHRFETQEHAMRIIADWIRFYNHRRHTSRPA